MAARKTYLTACALALVAKAAAIGAFASISSDAGASKPCNPDPSVPCVGPPPTPKPPSGITPAPVPVQPPVMARGQPAAEGDMVGRDLDSLGASTLGHIGIVITPNPRALPDSSVEVIEMSPEYPGNIGKISLAQFKLKISYWGAVFGSWGGAKVKTYWEDPHFVPYAPGTQNGMGYGLWDFYPVRAISNRVRAVYAVPGNAYTVTAYSRPMKPRYCTSYKNEVCTAPIPGLYRCDLLVFDAFRRATGDLNLGEPQDFSSLNIFMLPATIYGKYTAR
jgi:hypothetical protein